MIRERLKLSPYFRNWLSLAGLIVFIGSLFAFILLFALDVFAPHSNPYLGILMYVVAPGFTVLGAFLIALGALVDRRHALRASPAAFPHVLHIDLSRPRDRRVFGAFIAGTVFFLLLTAIGSKGTYQYSESTQFCGETCHTPMKPEYTAYLNSPHARVRCVECHVGEGAGWYVRSKLSGAYQLYSVSFNKYSRPIKSPVHNLRPAPETCEKCHWPEKFFGAQMKVFSHYAYDEKNSMRQTRMLINVGGGSPTTGQVAGIHWHMNIANKVEYVSTDDHRQVIPWI